jgi:hypothetical protein
LWASRETEAPKLSGALIFWFFFIKKKEQTDLLFEEFCVAERRVVSREQVEKHEPQNILKP